MCFLDITGMLQALTTDSDDSPNFLGQFSPLFGQQLLCMWHRSASHIHAVLLLKLADHLIAFEAHWVCKLFTVV